MIRASPGQAPASLVNIRLGWKGLPWTYSLAYYETFVINVFKKFYNIDTRKGSWCWWYTEWGEYVSSGFGRFYKLFITAIINIACKARVFLTNIFNLV